MADRRKRLHRDVIEAIPRDRAPRRRTPSSRRCRSSSRWPSAAHRSRPSRRPAGPPAATSSCGRRCASRHDAARTRAGRRRRPLAGRPDDRRRWPSCTDRRTTTGRCRRARPSPASTCSSRRCARWRRRPATGPDRPAAHDRALPACTSSGRPADKVVTYWSMRCAGGAFLPNREVDHIEWLAVDAGRAAA